MNAIAPVYVPVGVRWVRNLESVKWLGLFCMLVDHVNLYVLGGRFPAAEHVGALAFPLFAVALASGLSLSHDAKGWAVFGRLVFWAFVAQAACYFVRDGFPLNVIFSFALGLGAHLVYGGDGSRIVRVSTAVFMVLCGVFVEFSIPGVLFVLLLLEAFRSDRSEYLIFPLLVSAMLVSANSGSHFALLAGPVVMLLSLASADLPRIRGVFYWIYAGQFPVLWVGSTVL